MDKEQAKHDALITEIAELVETAKSSAEFFIPRYVEEFMDTPTPGSRYSQAYYLGSNGQALMVTVYVRNSACIEITFETQNGDRIGLIKMRRDRGQD